MRWGNNDKHAYAVSTYLGDVACAVRQTGVAKMNVPPVGGSNYFVKFIDKVSGHISAYHTRIKGEAAGLIQSHVCCVDHQTDLWVKKIVLYGGMKQSKVTKKTGNGWH